MKNFKKVLALVLVVVMAMSFATMSTAAFTDAESITKAEAVDVLSAIGVINGYGDGSFKPEGNVTRAEMAKMIATILNSGEDVGAMYAGACTFADSANHWAAGYIAYCAQEGIINGKNASTFDPDANVTGTEAAKMVLGALGHKADKAGLIGSAWASQTLSLAKKYALIGEPNNMTANMGQALNRENAAQLLFNGLKADMVEYTGGTNITIGNVVLNQGAEAKVQANYTGNTYAGSNATVSVNNQNQDALQLIEQCFPKLKLDTNTSADFFGRTCTTWEFENNVIGSYSTAPYITYTGEVTLGQLYTDLGKVGAAVLAANSQTATYFVDGRTNNTKAGYLNNANLFKSGEVDTVIGGQGVLTEVYFNENTYALNVVEINTYIAKIQVATDAKKDANGDVVTPAYVTLTSPVITISSNFEGATLADGSKLPTAGTFVTDEFTRADNNKTMVAITKGYNAATQKEVVMSVEKATAVTGTNKGSVAVNNTVTSVNIDATAYPVNAAYTYSGNVGQSETVYLDKNGNIIYTDAVTSSDYVLVMASNNPDWTDSTKWQAYVLKEDGTVATVELDQNYHTSSVADGLYSYTVNSEGKYHLVSKDANGTASVQVENKKPAATAGFQGTMNANTVFVIGEVNNGVTTYSAYTGIANVPSFTANGQTKTYVAMNAIDQNVVDAVFCEDVTLDGVATSSVMALFKTGAESIYTDLEGNSYASVKAIVDGQITTVKVDTTSTAWTQGLNTNNVFVLASGTKTNAAGNITGLTAVSPTPVAFTAFTVYADGVMSFTVNSQATAKFVDASIPVFVYNKTAKELQQSSVEALYPNDNGNVGYYTTDLVSGAITAIYAVID